VRQGRIVDCFVWTPGLGVEPDEAYSVTSTCAAISEAAAWLLAAAVEHAKPVPERWGTYMQVTDQDGHAFTLNDREVIR
jgi:hypothetical protein